MIESWKRVIKVSEFENGMLWMHPSVMIYFQLRQYTVIFSNPVKVGRVIKVSEFEKGKVVDVSQPDDRLSVPSVLCYILKSKKSQ